MYIFIVFVDYFSLCSHLFPRLFGGLIVMLRSFCNIHSFIHIFTYIHSFTYRVGVNYNFAFRILRVDRVGHPVHVDCW